MTYDYEISEPIAELMASQNAAITKYRLRENQLQGRDIGCTRASNEWFEKHFTGWASDQRRMVDNDLSLTDKSRGITSDSRVR